jgi:hypothetical protein
MEPLFAASHAKVQRAKTFIIELTAEQSRYAEVGVRTRIVVESHGPVLHVDWVSTGLLPGIILGDTVHNLRCALDLMAAELAEMAGHNPDSAYFPFAIDLDTLRKSHKFKTFSKCGDDCAKLLETIAPFHGGNEYLRALHDLDIQDKHRSVLPSMKDIDFSLEGEFEVGNPDNHSLVAKAEVVGYKFPDKSPLAGRPIIQSLEVLAQTVEGILEAFTALIAAREQSTDLVGN